MPLSSATVLTKRSRSSELALRAPAREIIGTMTLASAIMAMPQIRKVHGCLWK